MTDKKNQPAPFYDCVAILGLGLVGSSIARAIAANNLAGRMAHYDHDPDVREALGTLNLGGEVAATPADAVADADLIIIATPVGAMADVARAIAPAIREGATITDTGSTKTSVIRDVAPLLPAHCRFIPSHPVAGTENSGPDAGFAGLFRDRYWIVLDEGGGDAAHAAAVKKLIAFIAAMGALTEVMADAGYHDRVMAITSHLPHLIAYTIVGTAFDFESQIRNDVIRFSASGFRDFTRIAASDPVMWRDVFLNNGDAVLEMLGRFNEDLIYLQKAIRWQEGEKLEDLFTRTRAIRKKIRDIGQLD